MARTAWRLTDNSTGVAVDLDLDINPNAFDPPGRKATIVAQLTTAPNGQAILFQGRDQVKTATFSGVVNSQSFYDTLNTWKDKFYPLTLTDDLGNTWDIIIQDWTWTRLRRAIHPHRYDYQATVMIL